jgi:hypothetical protein
VPPRVSRKLIVHRLAFAGKPIGSLNASSLCAARQPLLVGWTNERRGSFGGRFTVRAPYICHIRSARRLTVQPTVRIACCTPLTLNSRASGICPGWRPPLQCDRDNERWNIGARGRGEASRPAVDILCCLTGEPLKLGHPWFE